MIFLESPVILFCRLLDEREVWTWNERRSRDLDGRGSKNSRRRLDFSKGSKLLTYLVLLLVQRTTGDDRTSFIPPKLCGSWARTLKEGYGSFWEVFVLLSKLRFSVRSPFSELKMNTELQGGRSPWLKYRDPWNTNEKQPGWGPSFLVGSLALVTDKNEIK